MNDHFVIVSLLTFIAIREIISQYNLHVLVNKVMSKDYWDYTKSKNSEHKDILEKADDDFDPVEDFNHIGI